MGIETESYIIKDANQICIIANVRSHFPITRGNFYLVYNNFLTGVPGTGAQYYCNSNMTCTAPSGTGCFRVNSAGGDYAFCGMSTFLPYQAGLDYVANLAPWIVPTITKIGNCTRSNVDSQGACYCDNQDFCNTQWRPNSCNSIRAIAGVVGLFTILTTYI